jgi:hypothetical protein
MSASCELPREHCMLNLGVSSHKYKPKYEYKAENIEYRPKWIAQNIVSTHMIYPEHSIGTHELQTTSY